MLSNKGVHENLIRVVGGGMTGLTMGYRLAQKGLKVVVHERDPYLGGLTSESSLGGVPIERFYHCVLPTDVSLLELFDKLELSDQVRWNKTRTGFFVDDTLMDMTTTRDFLTFPAITLFDRLRLGWTIAYSGANSSWGRLAQIPISTFLKRHSGEGVFRRIWEPLLLAKLGPGYDRFAASFIWATIHRMLSARKAKGRSEKLGFVTGRYGKVFSRLRAAIESYGGKVVANSNISGLSGSVEGWSVLEGGKPEAPSSVVLCVPAVVAANWLRQSVPASATMLRQVEYLGVICEVLLLKKPLTPYYVLNLTDKSLPFTGVIETSNLTGLEEFGGNALVYLPRYRDQSSPDWDASDTDVHSKNMEGLRRIVPGFREDDIAAWQVNRARYVQPVHRVGWSDHIPTVKLAERLAYVSTAQIFPWPVFNDEVVRNVDAKLSDVLAIVK